MPVWEGVLHLIEGLFLPNAGLLVFYIPCGNLVKLGLAQVVEQSADGEAFWVVLFRVKVLFHQRLVNHHTVEDKPLRKRTMELGAGGGGEKVGFLHPAEQSVRPLAGDVFLINTDKLLFVVLVQINFQQNQPLSSHYNRFKLKINSMGPCGTKPESKWASFFALPL